MEGSGFETEKQCGQRLRKEVGRPMPSPEQAHLVGLQFPGNSLQLQGSSWVLGGKASYLYCSFPPLQLRGWGSPLLPVPQLPCFLRAALAVRDLVGRAEVSHGTKSRPPTVPRDSGPQIQGPPVLQTWSTH